jgi:hypothetical protein
MRSLHGAARRSTGALVRAANGGYRRPQGDDNRSDRRNAGGQEKKAWLDLDVVQSAYCKSAQSCRPRHE